MTLEEMRNQVLAHQFSAAQYSSYADAKLNEGQGYVAGQTDSREIFDVESYLTITGTSDYELPANYLRLYTLVDAEEDAPLVEYEIPDFDMLDPAASGRPHVYCVDRGNLRLYPNPDAAYTLSLRFYRSPATMSAATDEPEIPANYHHLLVSYALSKCFERENDLTQAGYHWGNFERDLMKMRGEVQHDANDAAQASQVPGMWDEQDTFPSVRLP